MILKLFDEQRVLVCIDGLDEAAALREQLEVSIEHAAKESATGGKRLHVLLSTRENSYDIGAYVLDLIDGSSWQMCLI